VTQRFDRLLFLEQLELRILRDDIDTRHRFRQLASSKAKSMISPPHTTTTSAW